MTDVHDLIAACDELLDPAAFDDLGPNGLQVPGRTEIGRVITGVTAQRALFERAVALEGDLVLVHHGLFWNFDPIGLTPLLAERLRPLFKHDLALAAYHLPLDAHPEVGNNALLAGALGCADHVAFGTVGRGGTFAEPVPVTTLVERVAAACGGREPLLFDGGPASVRRIAIVSGGAAGELPRAVAEGYDAFLTGEPKEHVMADAREAGIHFIAAGHYATETHGIRRIGDLIAQRFGVSHSFVDIPNPV
jgi:dinuclear metal center YbgI/SA1388 family protein